MDRLRRALPLGTALIALIALVLCPDAAASSARAGLKLCAEMLVPSLLPFFILSGLLRLMGLPGALGRIAEPVTGRLFALSGAGASAMLMGLTGGYPLGAKAVGDLTRDGAMTPDEAERVLGFINNSGPAFLIGAAGTGVFHDRKLGVLLYLTHVLSAVILGVLLTPKHKAPPTRERAVVKTLSVGQALPQAVREAIDAMLLVCGFAVAFSVLTGLLDAYGVFSALSDTLAETFETAPQVFRALLTGLLELGSGIGAMQGLPPTKQNAALAAFLIGFGGVSVHCQTAAVMASTGVKLKKHFLARVLHGLLAAMMMLMI